jgi:two-component system sensor kinase FixL
MMSSDPFMPDGDPAGMLASILESSEDAILGERLDGTIVSWNRAAERIFGYAAAEIVGRPSSVLMPPGTDGQRRTMRDEIEPGGRVEPYETVWLGKGARPVDVLVTASSVRNRRGEVIGHTIVAHDVGHRRRLDLALRTTEARWRAIIDSAVDAIVVIDARGIIEAFNPAAERMFGYSEREAVGQNVTLLMPSPYRESHDRYVEHYLQTGEQKIIGIGREVTALRRDGTTFPVHLSVGEMRVGSERRFTGILHDLTARMQLEERLREQSELARLGEMAAVIAHEVRNPMAAVRGAIQVIGGHLPQGGKDAQVVKEIIARMDALNSLLNDLLLFARTPEPRLSPVSLAGLLTLTSDLLAGDPMFRNVQVQLQGDPPPIIADADLLKIVFQNLFINAAQAMKGGGTIRAAITVRGNEQMVRVSDAGPGIPAEVRDKLFRPFFTTKARGTGLGLSIAKRLVELHGGSIALESPPGGGTVVTVRLPANR